MEVEMKMRIIAVLICLTFVVMLSGCGLWEGDLFQTKLIETPSPSYAELTTEAEK